MKLFRVVVRFKLMQLFSIGAVSTPMVLFFGGAGENIENVSATTQMLFASASAFGAVGCSFALQEFANRYVGELALMSSSDEKKHWLRISSMDFWGNRVVFQKVLEIHLLESSEEGDAKSLDWES